MKVFVLLVFVLTCLMGFVACVDEPSEDPSGKENAPLADVGGEDINVGVDVMDADGDADVAEPDSSDAAFDSEVVED